MCPATSAEKFTSSTPTATGAVLAAQRAVLRELRPGVEWLDMHRLAERQILTALRAGGLLRGGIEEMMDAHLGAVFMPHGLGHLLARRTRRSRRARVRR